MRGCFLSTYVEKILRFAQDDIGNALKDDIGSTLKDDIGNSFNDDIESTLRMTSGIRSG